MNAAGVSGMLGFRAWAWPPPLSAGFLPPLGHPPSLPPVQSTSLGSRAYWGLIWGWEQIGQVAGPGPLISLFSLSLLRVLAAKGAAVRDFLSGFFVHFDACT